MSKETSFAYDYDEIIRLLEQFQSTVMNLPLRKNKGEKENAVWINCLDIFIKAIKEGKRTFPWQTFIAIHGQQSKADATSVSQAMSILKKEIAAYFKISKKYGKFENSVELNRLPKGVKLSKNLRDIRYNEEGKLLVYKGVMSEEIKSELLNLSTVKRYQKSINLLFQRTHFKIDIPENSQYAIRIIQNKPRSKKPVNATKDPIHTIKQVKSAKKVAAWFSISSISQIKLKGKTLFDNTFNIMTDCFFTPNNLVAKVKETEVPRFDAFLLIIVSIYFFINRLKNSLNNNLASRSFAKNHKEWFSQMAESLSSNLDAMLSAHSLFLLVTGLLLTAPAVILFYSLIKGESIKKITKTLRTPKVYANTLSLIAYATTFTIFMSVLLALSVFSINSFIAVKIHLTPLQFFSIALTNPTSILSYLETNIPPADIFVFMVQLILSSFLSVLSYITLFKYICAFNTLLELPKISGRIFISLLIIILVTFIFQFNLYLPHWLITIPTICGISLVLISVLSRKYPALN